MGHLFIVRKERSLVSWCWRMEGPDGSQASPLFFLFFSFFMLFFPETGDPENLMAQRKLTFGLLDSRMFNEFDGEWRMQFNSRKVCVWG